MSEHPKSAAERHGRTGAETATGIVLTLLAHAVVLGFALVGSMSEPSAAPSAPRSIPVPASTACARKAGAATLEPAGGVLSGAGGDSEFF